MTASYRTGARIVFDQAVRHACRHAPLTDRSPSCGSGFIHDGRFTGRRIDGAGVTPVLSHRDVAALAAAFEKRAEA